MKSLDFFLYQHHAGNGVSCIQTLGCLRLYAETVEFLERSLASILMRYCCSINWLLFFLDIIGSQKHKATYNFHILLPTAFRRPVIKEKKMNVYNTVFLVYGRGACFVSGFFSICGYYSFHVIVSYFIIATMNYKYYLFICFAHLHQCIFHTRKLRIRDH